MAIEQRVYDLSLNAASDLTDEQFHWAKGSGTMECDVAGAADEDLLGIIQNKPEDGQATEIRRVGISKMLCGGVISAWDKVTSDASGHGVAASDAERYGAISLEVGITGRIISVLMEFGYVEMT
jgi:hypothetical protein